MPRFSLNVAERTTGTERVIELEAPTEESAIAEAGNRGYVIESILAIEFPPALPSPVPALPYAEVVGAPRRWRDGFWLVATAFAILFVICAASWFLSRNAPAAGPMIMPPMAAPRPVGPQFKVTRKWFDNRHGQAEEVVFEILCLEASPISVTNVTFNRTHYAFEAKEYVGQFGKIGSAPIQLRTLKFGDKLLAWKNRLGSDSPADYTGQVVLLTINTNRGVADFVITDD